MMRTVLACTVGLVAAFLLASAGLGHADAKSGPLNVVAAENVYGNIVFQIGGAHVSVTSILSDLVRSLAEGAEALLKTA